MRKLLLLLPLLSVAATTITNTPAIKLTGWTTNTPPRWTDVAFGGMSFGFGATVPSRVAAYGTTLYSREWDSNDEGDFTLQTQHGTSSTNAALPNFYYEPHLHVSVRGPAFVVGNSNVVFTLVHQAGAPTADYGAIITLVATNGTLVTTNTHYLVSFGMVTNNALAGKDSFVARGTLYCDSSVTTNYHSEVIVDSLDFHIPVDAHGSTAIYGDSP